MHLNTKIQYQNFEPGEFVDIRPRTYNEVIECINCFTWKSERVHLQVSLTNPSITIESDINNFLKFALFYNGKFVLHFFNDQQELFTKSFYQKEKAFPYIKNLFESEVFDLRDFKKEPTFMQHNLVHFVTQDFHYTVTPKRIFDYLLNTSGFNFAIFFIFLIFILLTKGRHLSWLPTAGIMFLYFMIWGGGLNLLIFWNYYRFAKDKMLYMTKGDDTFYFGNQLNPVKYDKNDIRQVTIYSPGNFRNPVAFFTIVKIEFINGESIQIPNLLLSESALNNKLYKCKKVNKSRLKFIKRE